jgi:hypothetical protein
MQGMVVALFLIATGRSTTPAGVAAESADDGGSDGDGDGGRGGDGDSGGSGDGDSGGSGDGGGDGGSDGDGGDGGSDGDGGNEPTSAGRLKVPFGPFLAIGAIEFFFFGERLVAAYLEWTGL